jgi:hypothetical protein
MGNGFGYRILMGLLVIGLLAGVGAYSYNLGLAQGALESGRVLTTPGAGQTVVVWPRPWFGFGFFPFFPLLFIFFWIFVLRGLFWRGPWWGRGYRGGYGGVPPAFDEWHRRAHAEGPQEPPRS